MNKKITFVGKVFLNSQKYKYLKLYMSQFGGKDSKRHFTVVMDSKEHGLYVSSTPSSAARKAVTKLCTANKSKKVEFHIREITQGSKKKTYGPYSGYIEKLNEPIKLKGRIIKHKPVAKLSGKKGEMKGGAPSLSNFEVVITKNSDPQYKYENSSLGKDKLSFGKKIFIKQPNNKFISYFPILIFSDGSFCILKEEPTNKLIILEYNFTQFDEKLLEILNSLENNYFPDQKIPELGSKMKEKLGILLSKIASFKKQQQEQQIIAENKKIRLKGFNPDILGEMNLQYNGKVFLVQISDVKNDDSYIFFNETENIPFGTFKDFKDNRDIRSKINNQVKIKKIIIKIGKNGSVSELLSDQSLPDLNNNSGKLSNTSYTEYIKNIMKTIKNSMDKSKKFISSKMFVE